MNWLDDSEHHDWLAGESVRLLDFHAAARDPRGGFGWLDADGAVITDRPSELWITTRMVHSYSLGVLLERPGSRLLVEHGLAALRGMFHDNEYGGWFWSAYPDRAADDRKQTYGHAFVLLAASSAKQAGFPVDDLLSEALDVITSRLADTDSDLFVEGFDRSFQIGEEYRGQNPNMHLVEAFMAAAEATREPALLEPAVRIAGRIIGTFARNAAWRVPEHFTTDWQPDPTFNRDNPRDMLRPYGATPGHWLEWARLLIQLDALVGHPRTAWMTDAARQLFDAAVTQGWDRERTGLVYTVDWDGSPCVSERFHWGAAEGIGAAAYLFRTTQDEQYANWYRVFWEHTVEYLIDRTRGGWHHELSPTNEPTEGTWVGKPDLYHALQATLFARVPITVGLAEALAQNPADR
jgi:mannose/cellobiose epimerase-like protein (N-acyl-D-glucosamine 2-epimerase family)